MPEVGETRTRKDGKAKATWDGANWVETSLEIGGLSGGADTSVGPAPGSAFMASASARPKMFAKTEQELMDLDSNAQTAQSLRADASRFKRLNEDVSTGGFGGLPVIRDIRAMADPKVGEMKAIVEKMTPAMREAGSGAMSDRDVEMYRASVVGLDKLGPTNSALATVIDAGARRSGDYTAFKNEWARRNNTLVGSQEAWQAYAEDNPLFEGGDTGTKVRQVTPWRQYFGLQELKAKPTEKPLAWSKSLPDGVRTQLPRAPADNQPSKAVIGEIERMKKVGEWDGAKPRGSEANPFVAVNPRVAAKLPKGSFYLDAKGDLYVQD